MASISGATPFNVLGEALSAALDIGLSYLVIRLGLTLGSTTGLDRLVVEDPDAVPFRSQRIRRAVLVPAAWGAAIALCVGIGSALLGDRWHMRTMQPPSAGAAVLASFGAGVYEEVWFRLGLMTIVVWVAMRVSGRQAPSPAMMWIGNAFAAVAFGAAHLPLAFSVAAPSASFAAYVVAANGVVGLTCGWLYWRRGLLAAMVAHAAVDLMLKVALPLLHPL
jgi:membrane protease YdiL (CAAX protease family)